MNRRALLRSPWTRRIYTSSVDTLQLAKRDDVEFRKQDLKRGKLQSFLFDGNKTSAKSDEKKERAFMVTRKVTDAMLVFVASGWWGALRRCNFSMNELISDSGIRIVVASLGGQLESLDLSGCEKLTDVAVFAVARSCRKLSRLGLNALTQLSDASMVALGGGEEGTLAAQVTSVKKMTKSADMSKDGRRMLRSQGWSWCIEAMRPKQGQKRIVWEGCVPRTEWLRRITDKGVEALARNHGSTLRQLELNGCACLTDIGACNRAALQNLMFLELGWCHEITDAGIAAVSGGCIELSAVNLSGNSQLSHQSSVTLASHCAWLAALNLFRCHGMAESLESEDLLVHGLDGEMQQAEPGDVAREWLLKRSRVRDASIVCGGGSNNFLNTEEGSPAAVALLPASPLHEDLKSVEGEIIGPAEMGRRFPSQARLQGDGTDDEEASGTMSIPAGRSTRAERLVKIREKVRQRQWSFDIRPTSTQLPSQSSPTPADDTRTAATTRTRREIVEEMSRASAAISSTCPEWYYNFEIEEDADVELVEDIAGVRTTAATRKAVARIVL